MSPTDTSLSYDHHILSGEGSLSNLGDTLATAMDNEVTVPFFRVVANWLATLTSCSNCLF
jgi:hypothetical protein